MNKKIVVLGGGTGMSTLLRGLKNFPVDITAVVSVSDDGQSTGRLREEFNIPAVGDIRKVIVALSETEPLVQNLLNYRFETSSDLNGHTLGNLLLTGLFNITGNMSAGITSLGKVLNLKGQVLPLTEDNVTLMAKMDDESIVEGEHNITAAGKNIKEIYYKEEPKILTEVLEEIKVADLIVLSMGSLYTSIIPNLISEDIRNAIDESNAEILYVCNIMTQPGETDDFSVSDHINILNHYLGEKKIQAVVANNGPISDEIKEKYLVKEQKDPVLFDKDILDQMGITVIAKDFVFVEDGILRHNVTKLGLQIFSYILL